MEKTVNPKRKHKVLKWFLGIFGFFLLIALAGAWYINKKWKPLLTTAIQNTIIDATDSLYHVKFSNIQVNILSGSVIVDSIDVEPDLDVYQKLIMKGEAPENLFAFNIYKLNIKNVSPLKVYKERKLDIKNINILNPSLTIFYTKLKNQKNKPEDNRTPYQRIESVLKELKIGSIFLTDVKFKYVDQSFKKPKIISFDKMNIRINDILIDSISNMDSTRMFNAKDIIAQINNYEYATPDSMYHIKIKQAFVSSGKKQLVLSGVGLVPRFKEMAFANQFKQQQERYKINFDSVLLDDIDFNNLLETRTVAASNIKLKNGNLAVFLNRGKPQKNIDKGMNFPHIALQRVSWGIKIDTLKLKNIDVSYTEYNPKADSKGTIYLNDLDGRVLNITNDSLSLTKNNISNAHLETLLMGKSKLILNIGLVLNDPKGAFTYKGSLGSMHIPSFNSLIIPLAMVKVSSGELESLDFNMKGSINGAGGRVVLKYSDLHVTLMKIDEEENFKKMGLVSLLANALLLNNSNPDGNRPLRIANVYYNRPKGASFFNLMWKGIFDGLKESIGITKEKENKLLARAAKFKQSKIEREKRKTDRQKRREERKNN